MWMVELPRATAESSWKINYVDSTIPSAIVVGPNASQPERYAAKELSRVLNNIACASAQGACSRFFVTTSTSSGAPQLAVGWQATKLLGLKGDVPAGLGQEGFVVSTQQDDGVPVGSVVLTGAEAAPRGTLYAVNAFLEALGVEFLAQDTTILPTSLPQALPPFSTVYEPAMEYRNQFEYTMRVRTVSWQHLASTLTHKRSVACRDTRTNLSTLTCIWESLWTLRRVQRGCIQGRQ